MNLILLVLFATSAVTASNATAQSMSAARLEMLDWLDPERALQIVEAAPPSFSDAAPEQIEMLTIEATVFANNNRYKDVEDIERRLDAAATGEAAATRAAHYVRTYLATLQGEFLKAEAEFKLIDFDLAASDIERYRLLMFSGYLSRTLGKDEAALPVLERAKDLATNMHDPLRILCATLAVGRLYIDSGNFDRGSAEAEAARHLAAQLGEEGALADAWEFTADIAVRRGDSAADRRASLVALEHARRSGSSKWLSTTLGSLADSYLDSGNYAESLKYSKEGLQYMLRRNDRVDIESTLFLEGMAYIGLGRVKEGQQLAEDGVKKTLAGGNLLAARGQLFQYERALEHAGYLTLALEVYHRYTDTSEKFMTSERQRAFLELSAQFDNERKAAELDKLKAESSAASAIASRATLVRNISIYVGLSLLLGTLMTAWTLRRRRDVAQARKASAERLAALGRLTGGIAHEFNNQLTVVQQALGLLAKRPYLTTDPEGKALLEELQDSSRVLANTTEQLQSFSRQQNLRQQSIPLAAFLQSNRTVLARTAGTTMALQINIESEPLSTWADERQLLAALINLVANARDASNETGSILIEVAAQDQRSVRISVIDSGMGMDAEILSRAAEPFFTTKPVGGGTGLGLSMVDGFVRQSGGRLILSSEMGRGTVATMILPRFAPSS
jgi:signal transduction histidine kinase